MRLFKKKKSEDYWKIGGPRSFHKFKYNQVNIILIGEIHADMTDDLATRCREQIQSFIEQQDSTKLFIEMAVPYILPNEGSSNEESLNGISFLEMMDRLEGEPNLELIRADSREISDSFGQSLDFLQFLLEIAESLSVKCKEAGIPMLSLAAESDAKISELITVLKSAADKAQHRFSDLIDFLIAQEGKIGLLVRKYMEEHEHLARQLIDCQSFIAEGVSIMLSIQQEYRALEKQDEETGEIFNQMCVAILEKKGTFDRAVKLWSALRCYTTKYLDATLSCDLWEEIKNANDTPRTIIVVAGDAHIRNLSLFFKKIAITIASIPKDQFKATIIRPEQLKELFELEEAPSKKSCVVM